MGSNRRTAPLSSSFSFSAAGGGGRRLLPTCVPVPVPVLAACTFLLALQLLLLLPAGAAAFHCHPSPPSTVRSCGQTSGSACTCAFNACMCNCNYMYRPTTRTSTSTSTSSLNVGSPFRGTGWDNDDFLSSLADDTNSNGNSNSNDGGMEEDNPARALAAATAALGRDQSGHSMMGYPYMHAQQPQASASAGPAATATATSTTTAGGVQRNEVVGGALPLGWSAHFDPDSRSLYYYNVNDGTTQWDRPASPPPPPPPNSPRPTSTYMGSGISNGFGGGLGEDSVLFGGGQPMQPQPQRPFAGPPTPQTAVPGAASLPPDEARQADSEVPIDETIDGAVLTDEMKARIKASHTQEEEAGGGGQRFRQMMERARQEQGSRPAPTAEGPLLPPDAAGLPPDEQGRLYRELLWRRQNPQVQSYATPQHQISGIGIDGRKIGRNRDSDMISNSADVYLAQLKRDSTTRNLARYAGDDAKANAVFHDAEGLAAIKGPEENPYLKERRERERDLVETVPEEMLLFQDYDGRQQAGAGDASQQPTPQERQGSGISYRDRLRQAQEQKRSSQQ